MAEHSENLDRSPAEAHAPYLKVFLALLVLTVLEYFYAMTASRLHFPFVLLVSGLMVLALTKAVLVAMFFMHVKYEGRWVYLLIVPACLMATIVVLGLYPDIGRHRASASGSPVSSAKRVESDPGDRERSVRLGMNLGREAVS